MRSVLGNCLIVCVWNGSVSRSISSKSNVDIDGNRHAISIFMAGNALVTPLVLHRVVGGGDHLPSGVPYARLACLFS